MKLLLTVEETGKKYAITVRPQDRVESVKRLVEKELRTPFTNIVFMNEGIELCNWYNFMQFPDNLHISVRVQSSSSKGSTSSGASADRDEISEKIKRLEEENKRLMAQLEAEKVSLQQKKEVRIDQTPLSAVREKSVAVPAQVPPNFQAPVNTHQRRYSQGKDVRKSRIRAGTVVGGSTKVGRQPDSNWVRFLSVVGKGLKVGQVGEKSTFLIHDKTMQHGKKKGVQLKDVRISIQDTMGVVKCAARREPSGISILYTPKHSGLLHISISAFGVALIGSPFTAMIRPGPLSVDHSGLSGIQQALVGDKLSLVVRLRDKYGNDWLGSGVKVKASLDGDSGQAKVKNEQDGSYRIDCMSKVAGKHGLTVAINGQVMKGTPFMVYFEANVATGATCTTTLPTTPMRSGESQTLEIIAKDKYGNRTVTLKDGLSLFVELYGDGEAKVGAVGVVKLSKEGTFTATFRAPPAGRYRMEVRVGDQFLPGFPQVVEVIAGKSKGLAGKRSLVAYRNSPKKPEKRECVALMDKERAAIVIQSYMRGRVARRVFQERIQMHRQRMSILKRMIAAEQSYSEHLKQVTTVFQDVMRKEGVLVDGQYAIVFSNISYLALLAASFQKRLVQRSGIVNKILYSPAARVGGLFSELAPSLKDSYIQYCRGYYPSKRMIEWLLEHNESFQTFLQSRQHLYDLDTLLSLPLQHYHRYESQLKEYVKVTPRELEEYHEAVSALEELVATTNAVEKEEALARNLDYIIEIQRSVPDLKIDLADGSHTYVREHEFYYRSKGKKGKGVRRVVLFTDLLIVLRAVSKAKTEFRVVDMVDLGSVYAQKSGEYGGCIHIVSILDESEDCYLCEKDNPELLENWLIDITKEVNRLTTVWSTDM